VMSVFIKRGYWMEEWSKRKKGSANKWPTPEFASVYEVMTSRKYL